ncbi:MAG: host-nuclease inhibitor Gam family protein [Azoarcus sp.]|nr:host-nuclease inhibitor Gam family protein [Azoarcus sp.]
MAKSETSVRVCQSREETQSAIRELGNARRELTRVQTHLNDGIAALTAGHAPQIDALRERIDALALGIQLWCENHRAELTPDGGKTANLVTGEVHWNAGKKSVSIRDTDRVIEIMRTLGMKQFLRDKTEINKNAILENPEAVLGIPGIKVTTGVETFSVTPFEIEVPE